MAAAEIAFSLSFPFFSSRVMPRFVLGYNGRYRNTPHGRLREKAKMYGKEETPSGRFGLHIPLMPDMILSSPGSIRRIRRICHDLPDPPTRLRDTSRRAQQATRSVVGAAQERVWYGVFLFYFHACLSRLCLLRRTRTTCFLPSSSSILSFCKLLTFWVCHTVVDSYVVFPSSVSPLPFRHGS